MKPDFKLGNNPDLLIFYSNVDSLLNKRNELNDAIFKHDPDVIQITEYLPKYIKDKDIDFSTDLHIPGFLLFLNKDPKRGIATYVKSSLDASIIDTKKCDFIEKLCLSIKLNGKNIFIGCIYRSPSHDKSKSTNELIDLFYSLQINKYDKFLMTGDFNYPNIDWAEKVNLNEGDRNLINCLDDLFLQQMVTEPTRNVLGQKCNILDLILTNDELFVNSIVHIAPLGSSDHDILLISINIPKVHVAPPEPRFNFSKADYEGLRVFLSEVDWSKLDILDVNESWSFFAEIMHNSFKLYVPKSKVKPKSKPFWLNKKCMKSIRKKYTFFKRFKESDLSYDYKKYIEHRNKAKSEIRKAVKNHEKKIVKESKTNPRSFWKYVNTKLSRSTGIPNLTKTDGNLTSSDDEKANVLNSFFSSVFTQEDLSDIPNIENLSKNTFLTDIIITRDAVKSKLKNLNPAKAMGPDKIPGVILKELNEELSIPLSIIFNKSLHTGVVPSGWKTAEVSAIFKKGNNTDPGNYRPVSLTSISCKILESIVTDEVRKFMETNKLFNKCQHGFRNKRSCVTQLLEVLNDFTKMVEKGECIDVIYLDFSKAFDTVPHQRLLNKLKANGIQNNLLKWIESFLSNRTQRVRVNASYSDYVPVTSGIPQGSILGPLLFIIFINDLSDGTSCPCKIFADDTKSYDIDKNHKLLQKDLLTFLKWSAKWLLKFNKSKCSVLHMGKNNRKEKYYMDEDLTEELKSIDSEKDVGVTFSKDLKFNLHINNVIKKSNQLTGLIKRSFTYTDRQLLLNLYKSIVRPHLEYANVIWHPFYKNQLVALEKVQRRYTKFIPGLSKKTYQERLLDLKLPSIKYRQLRGDLIQTYKIIHNIDNLQCSEFFSFNQNNTRNSNLKLNKEFAQCNSRKNFLSLRINNVWNSLKETTKTADSMLKFKICIDRELSDIMYKFDE